MQVYVLTSKRKFFGLFSLLGASFAPLNHVYYLLQEFIIKQV